MAQYLDHTRVNPNDPRRAAQCQRCGDVYNLESLTPQFRWAGLQSINTHVYVCPRCLDVPNQQERTIILPPDPPPSLFALPIKFPAEENDYIAAEDGTALVDEATQTQFVPEGN